MKVKNSSKSLIYSLESHMGFKPFKSNLTKKDFSKSHGPENSYWKRAA